MFLNCSLSILGQHIFHFCFRNEDPGATPLTTGWWNRFKHRHPELSVRTPSLVDPGRASMSRSTVMDPFFERVEEFMQQNNLLNQSARIYNIDETWFTPNAEKAQRVITRRSNRMPFKIYSGAQSHTTLTMCI